MPSIVKVRVERARDLPIMDGTADAIDASTDAYCEIHLETQTYSTSTIRRSLAPVWSQEFEFVFVDDSVLQDEALELRVYDHDLYSSELIGTAFVDLQPLLMRTGILTSGRSASEDRNLRGWFPLFDTVHGIRGNILVSVKLQWRGNVDKWRDSSAGIAFFSTDRISGRAFFVQEVCGFVEELVVQSNEDGSWGGYLKANKTSTDSRLRSLYSLTAETRRKLGKSAQIMGANAVLGYRFQLDTEGASGIVGRASGTACRLLRVDHSLPSLEMTRSDYFFATGGQSTWRRLVRNIGSTALLEMDTATQLFPEYNINSVNRSGSNYVLLHAVDEDNITATPLIGMGNEVVNESHHRPGGREHHRELPHLPHHGTAAEEEAELFKEVLLLTVSSLPPHVHARLGGLVMARSVKYFGKLDAPDEQTALEDWWRELREEIKGHALTLSCFHVLGYRETVSFHNDVCVLTAVGTAARIRRLAHSIVDEDSMEVLPEKPMVPASTVQFLRSLNRQTSGSELRRHSTDQLSDSTHHLSVSDSGLTMEGNYSRGHSIRSFLHEKIRPHGDEENVSNLDYELADGHVSDSSISTSSHHAHLARFIVARPRLGCASVHTPYRHRQAPFGFMRVVPCVSCGRKWVPEALFSTTEPPRDLPINGRGRLIEARVTRTRRPASGEAEAVKISELLPFLEYDLQRRLMLKMRALGANAAFGYSCSLQLSNELIIVIATCTAVQVAALPPAAAFHVLDHRENAAQIEASKAMERWGLWHRETLAKNSLVEEGQRSLDTRLGGGIPRSGPLYESESSSSESSSSSDSLTSDSDDLSDGDGSSLESPSESSSSSDSSDEDSASQHSGAAERNGDATSRKSISTVSTENDEHNELALDESRGRRGTTSRGRADRVGRDDDARAVRRERQRRRMKRFTDDRLPFVLEVDDDTDADIHFCLTDWVPPDRFDVSSVSSVPGSLDIPRGTGTILTVFHRATIVESSKVSISADQAVAVAERFQKLLRDAYLKLFFAARRYQPCQLVNVQQDFNLIENGMVEILLSAAVFPVSPSIQRSGVLCDMGLSDIQTTRRARSRGMSGFGCEITSLPGSTGASAGTGRLHWVVPLVANILDQQIASLPSNLAIPQVVRAFSSMSLDLQTPSENRLRDFSSAGSTDSASFELILGGDTTGREETQESLSPPNRGSPHISRRSDGYALSSINDANTSTPQASNTVLPGMKNSNTAILPPESKSGSSSTNTPQLLLPQVLLTPLTVIPGARVQRYLGPVNLHFIKDSHSLTGDAAGAFYHRLLSEVHSAARSHVAALGGNALLCFRVIPQEAGGRVSRNQGYTMFSVSGDVVQLEFAVDTAVLNGTGGYLQGCMQSLPQEADEDVLIH